MSNKVIKSVSFNITSSDDAAILKAVKRKNFSGYVKKLIMEDLKRGSAVVVTPEVRDEAIERVVNETRESNVERLERLKQNSGQRMPAATKPFISQPRN